MSLERAGFPDECHAPGTASQITRRGSQIKLEPDLPDRPAIMDRSDGQATRSTSYL